MKISENLFGAFHNDIFNRKTETKHQYITIDTTGLVNTFSEPIIFKDRKISDFTKLSQHTIDFEKFRIDSLEYSFADDGKIKIKSLSFDMPINVKSHFSFQLSEPLLASEDGAFFHPKYKREINSLDFIHPSFHNSISPEVLKEKPIRNVWIKTKNPEYPTYPYQNLNLAYRGYHYDKFSQTSWLASRPGVESSHFEPNYFTHISNPFSNIQLAGGIGIFSDSLAILCIQNISFFYSQKTNEEPNLTKLDLGSQVPIRIIIPDGDNYWLVSRNSIYQLNKHHILERYSNVELLGLGNAMWVDDKIWISTHEKIIQFDPKTKEFSSFNRFNKYEKAKSEGFKWLLKIDENHLWILTNSSLYLCSKQKGIIEEFEINNTEEKIQFNQISEAKSNFSQPTLNTPKKPEKVYWLSSLQGLIRLTIDGTNFKTLDIEHFNMNTGLQTNEILAAFEDDYGFVWMPTPHGLIQLQPEAGLSRLYTKADGLSNSGFQNNTFAEAPDGRLYFGSYEGFNIFHPKDFKDVELSPEIPLIILDYEQHSDKSGKIEYRLEDILKENEIVLAPGDKLFNIRVALKDYRNAEDHRFAYKIEGFQDEWSEDRSNLVRISGLPYGEFVLKIKGRLHNGLFSRSELEIPIHVLKPFYLQTWFLISLSILVILGTYFFNFWRTKQLKARQKLLEKSIEEATGTILQDKSIIESQAEELRELDKVKSRFFANVSHELRTPLTLLLSPLKSVLEAEDLSFKNRKALSKMLESGDKLSILINEILELSKLEAEQMKIYPKPVILYNLVRRITAAFESLAEREDIHLSFSYLINKEFKTELDEEKFEIVLNNLLSNAIKFTPPDGQIQVLVENLGAQVQIQVKDTGRGIHPDDLPRIFERYFQTAQPNAPAEGGTGIGLALSHEIAKLFDGKLWAESELGQGSCFIFQFPAIEIIGKLNNKEAIELSRLQQPKKEVSNNIKPSKSPQTIVKNKLASSILLVEDNHDLREYLRSILEDRYNILEANNGKVAWDLLNQEPKIYQPHLIITDLMMPIMDGFQFIRQLKNSDAFRHLPIIVLTAKADVKDKIETLRVGVDDYMLKPFEKAELTARVENLLYNFLNRFTAQKNNSKALSLEKQLRISKEETEWLKDLENQLKEQMVHSNFKIDDLLQAFGMNRTYFYQKVKKITGLTPNQYLQELRLNEARFLLETKPNESIKTIAFAVGFKDRDYFSQLFKTRFGKLPSEYIAV